MVVISERAAARVIIVIPERVAARRVRESAVCRCGFLTKRQIPEPCGPQNLTERQKKGITPAK